ncbi:MULTISPECIES: DUF3574 domain-containing protein [Streptomyces]|uniref:DUF3574 domain-containing protein n=1 Tax=Streptomyces TaxID=1883 RepID=UPI001E2D0C4B|nr:MULTISPECIES: DUF3574 domain-containing protein [Streptomyces]UFQ15010.1 DUF3574 domain-containing protein [Streptomyces huasconensis]WCL84616.1 DUF3574 domain-containing protein [Streptomyces sp. JCM 35825]
MTPTLSRLTRSRLAVAGAATAVLAVAAPAAYASLDDAPRSSSAFTAASTAASSDAAAPSKPARGKPYNETRLFFGTERPDGGPAVTDKQFMAFIDKEVTPGFPDGLTIQDGRGQWRDSNGRIERERSYELILLYPAGEARERDVLIEEIRSDYEKAFAQESVARLDERTRVDF